MANAQVTFTVSDTATFATPLATTADLGALTVADIIAAYRSLAPDAYAVINTGTVDANNHPIMHTLSNSETVNKIAGTVLQGILDNVTRWKHQQALAAVAPPAPATFVVL